MLLFNLILIPLIGMFLLSAVLTYNVKMIKIKLVKMTALLITIIALIISLIVYIQFDFSCKQFQFVQEQHDMGYFDFHFGVDGLSIYFILLTTIIMPISLMSN
jgi:NADH:ubiquinone oxidoreductase subunit 4 (subunit M)